MVQSARRDTRPSNPTPFVDPAANTAVAVRDFGEPPVLWGGLRAQFPPTGENGLTWRGMHSASVFLAI